MGDRLYTFVGAEPLKEPDYRRVVESLRNAELLEEAAAGKGGPAYQAAVAAEIDRRRLGTGA